MEYWVDTHAHLFDEAFDGDRAEVVERAREAGVGWVVLPNIDETTTQRVLEMGATYPDFCHIALGLHPTSVRPEWRAQMAAIEREMASARQVAVGEIGVDLYWDRTQYAEQMAAFRYQLGLARELGLPVLVHAREAQEEVVQTLRAREFSGVRAVLHAFSGGVEALEAAMALDGAVVGVGGVATYKNGLGAPFIQALELSRTVLETDAPYLTPVPHRGKRNESAYIPLIGAHIASVRGEEEAHVRAMTTACATEVLGLLSR